MKNNKNLLSTVHFDSDASFSFKRRPKSSNLIFRVVLCFAGVWSAFSILESFFKFGLPLVSITVYSVVFLLFSAVFYLAKSRTVRLSILAAFLLNILFFLIKIRHIIDGVYLFVYDYLILIKRDHKALDERILDIRENYSVIDCRNYASLALALIILVILVFSVLYYTNFITAFIATFPFFELGMYWGINPELAPLLVMIVFWVCIMSMQLITFSVRKGSKNNVFSFHGKENTFYLTSTKLKRSFNAQIGAYTAIICAAVFAFVFIGWYVSGYARPEILNTYRYHIAYAVKNFSFEEFTEEVKYQTEQFFESFTNNKIIGGISSGELGDVETVKFNNEDTLIVTVASKPTATIYLRGFAAGDYSSREWGALPDRIYNASRSVFNNAEQQNIFTGNISGKFIQLYFDSIGKTANSTISVKNLTSNEELMYIPYNSYFNENSFDFRNDSFIQTNGDTYSTRFYNIGNVSAEHWCSFYDNSKETYSTFLNSAKYSPNKSPITYDEKFSSLESSYRSFVYDNYLDFDEKLYPEIQQSFSGVRYSCSIDTIISNAQNYVWNNAEYSLSPGKTPSDEDFIRYFLYENKLGYCSHFASAGVMIFRAAGIPSRYAEGFIATPDLFEKTDEGYTANVKDNAAHAWVEIYVDTIGWVPVEMTPGGYSEGVNPNAIETTTTAENENSSSGATTTSDNNGYSDEDSPISSDSQSSNSQSGSSGSSGTNGSQSGGSSDDKNSSGNAVNSGASIGSGNANGGSDSPTATVISKQKTPFFEGFKNAISQLYEENKDIITVVLISVICITILLISILLRKRIILYSRKKRHNSVNRNSAVKAMYTDVQSVLHFWGLDRIPSSDIELMEELSLVNYPLARTFNILFEAASEAQYSEHMISEETYTAAKKRYNRIIRCTKMRLTKAGKIFFRYFICM